MRLSVLGLAVIAQILFNVAVSIATDFGCNDNTISDEWRQAILDFHNRYRRRVAQGIQVSEPTKVMPAAKKMNELYWDCNIEYNAFLRNCNGGIALPADYAEIAADMKFGNNCNATEKAVTLLKDLWDNEVKLKDLSQNLNYDEATQKNFGIMVFHETTGIGCTYHTCSKKLLCLYNKAPANGNALYTAGDCTAPDGCAQGGTSTCVYYLCKLNNGYTPGGSCTSHYDDYTTDTYPRPLCAMGNDDGMTYEMQISARDMVNYYRRLVASGWAPDKTDYAPPAKKMIAVEYDCDTIGMATKALADDCAAQSYTATAGYSLSSYKVRDLSKTKLEILSEAIKTWAEQSKLVDLDGDVAYSGDVETSASDFAKMMNAEVTKVGCAVGVCPAQGFKVAICQYDQTLYTNDPVYTFGKPCSQCAAPTPKCDNSLGGGLCTK